MDEVKNKAKHTPRSIRKLPVENYKNNVIHSDVYQSKCSADSLSDPDGRNVVTIFKITRKKIQANFLTSSQDFNSGAPEENQNEVKNHVSIENKKFYK
jgi:hypothetical protein